MLLALGALAAAALAAAEVEAPGGIFRGRRLRGAEVFLGVRYARAARFEVARLEPWQGMVEVQQQQPRCWRPKSFPCVAERPEVACRDLVAMSEDCFFLDIYRPIGTSNTSSKAVMVWIHGGGMTVGDSGPAEYMGAGNGAQMAKNEDVLVVSVNYRLGPLGFLPLRPFQDANGTGGMNGIHDQIVSLHWLRQNLPAFGGDLKRVTLFGCSAGSLSICTLSASPLAEHLFQRGILQSGPCVGPWGPGAYSEGRQVLQRFLGSAKITLEEVYNLPPWAMLWGQGEDQYDIEFPGYWIDGWVAPEHPHLRFLNGHMVPDDLMLGATSRDGVLGTNYISPADLPTTVDSYSKAVWKHWRPRNSSGGIFGVNRLLPQNVGDEVVSAYPLAPFQELGGPAAAFKAADGDYHVLCPTRIIALQALKHGKRVYLYDFAYGPLKDAGCSRPDVGDFRASDWANHGDEKNFIFGNYNLSEGCQMQPAEVRLSRAMQSAWASFARRAQPRADWRSFKGSEIYRWDERPKNSDFDRRRCEIWEEITRNYSWPKLALLV